MYPQFYSTLKLYALIYFVLLVSAFGCGERKKIVNQKEKRAEPSPKIVSSNAKVLEELNRLGVVNVEQAIRGEKHFVVFLTAKQLDESGKIRNKIVKDLMKLNKLAVDVRGKNLHDDALKQLAGLKGLTSLLVYGPSITDKGIAHFEGNKCVKIMNLGMCFGISESCLDSLAQIDCLDTLIIAGPAFGDKMFDRLARFPALSTLMFSFTDVTEEGLAGLLKLKNLKKLRVSRHKHARIPHIGKLKQLEELSITNSPITDDAMRSITPLTNLRVLNLLGSLALTDKGLMHIRELDSLKKLDLGTFGDLNKTGVTQLSNMTKLQSLNLEINGLNDEEIAIAMKGKSELEHLFLAGNDITDDGLLVLRKLKNLKTLTLANNKFSNAGLSTIESLVGLETLDLDQIEFSANSLQKLGKLTNLKLLSLNYTNITDESLKHLAALGKLEQLNIYATKIGDRGLESLYPLKNLKYVHAIDTSISDVGVKKLQKQIPNCIVKLKP